MAAQCHLNCGREPAQVEAIIDAMQKRRFRQVHFLRHALHPGFIARRVQDANGCRITAKRFVRESINLRDSLSHMFSLLLAARAVEAVINRFGQRLPACFDNVRADTDRAPTGFLVGRLN